MADNSLFDFPGLNIKWGQKLTGDVTGKLPKGTLVTGLTGMSISARAILGNATAAPGPPTGTYIASSLNTTIPTVSGSITVGNLATWSDTVGTLIDGGNVGPINRAPTANVTINSNYSLMVLRKYTLATNLKLAILADGVMRIS